MMQMTTSTPPPPIAERRPVARKRALLGGIAVYAEGRRSFPCTIRNVSAKGARIAFAPGQPVPSSFHLINLRDLTVYRAHIVWAGDSEAGLALEAGMPMDALPHDLRYLKRFSGR